MDDLLRAADVAVHSTGGVTSLEALSCGCPLIGYGSSIGHIRVHNRTMAALGLITLADTRAQLEAALRSHLVEAPTRSAPLPAAGADAAAALIGMRSPCPAAAAVADRLGHVRHVLGGGGRRARGPVHR